MIQKHRISTKIGQDQKVVVDLKQEYDLLEILSLKFTQKDIYTSLCSDYGVVCGRVTANNGFGVPNARVSIFVPISEKDKIDPIISALYPYTDTTVKNENNYRYNLLPSAQQHGGHTPTGTFFDQEDILTREEVLEVFENYYRYTVKTNESGDYMIWGVPLGSQTIHVDLDLSDIGCFSLRPYDFIRKGTGVDEFERYYKFKASEDIDGLPQIVNFEKYLDIHPFWGNKDLCDLGITRADFDLSEKGIKIEPISLILASTITDDNGDAVKRSGVIRRKSGYKCNLQTSTGKVECIRYTGKKVYNSDKSKLYPELEAYNITETIDQDGVIMIPFPMNMEYVYTNEFGEQEITNDTNKGIPTTAVGRFRMGLDSTGENTTTAKYLIPNIREYNDDTVNGGNYYAEYEESLLTTYQFSTVFEDYLNLNTTGMISGVTSQLVQMSSGYQSDKESLMLGTNNGGVPEDYFYKFIFGKVYTVSSFQGTHYETSAVENLLGLSRRDAFLGLKEIRPNTEDDCTAKANYIPTNYAFRNRLKFGLLISDVLLFIQYLFTVVSLWIYETLGRILWDIGGWLARQDIIFIGHALADAGFQLRELSFRLMEGGQTTLPLTTYPDCEECTTDTDGSAPNAGLNVINLYYRSAEIKTKVVPYNGFVYLIYLSGQTPNYLNSSTTTGTTFLPNLFPDAAAKEIQATGITESQLTLLHNYTNPNRLSEKRFIGGIYPLIGSDSTTDIFNSMYIEINSAFASTQLNGYFSIYTVSTPTNTNNSVRIFNSGGQVNAKYVDATGGPINAPEDINVTLLIRNPCNYSYRTQIVTILSGQTTSGYATLQSIDCGGGYYQTETYERVVSFSPTGYREYNTGTPTTYTNVPALKLSYSDWAKYGGKDYTNGGIDAIKDLYAVIRVYDRGNARDTTTTELVIEQGCSKYDTFYDESSAFKYLWSSNGGYGTIDDVTNYNNPSGPRDVQDSKRVTYDWGVTNNTYYRLGAPNYSGTPYIETSTTTSPGVGYSLMATIAGGYDTKRLPNIADLERGANTYSKKTKSGLTEIRDGVFTIVPVINGTSKNQTVIREWYRRKRVGMFFCGGVTNYSFIDNWLHGLLYFFKFDKRIRWDNASILDMNQRGSKYPRELVFYNVLDQNFYYRSTPYNPTAGFIGQRPSNSYRELLHPTTFYDVGVRDEFLFEICTDPRVDPTCSVIRDIHSTSYQDPANIVEYAINYRMDSSNASYDVGDFFTGREDANNNTFSYSFDGDITQLMSINCEAGIEAFDLDSPHYFNYNGELMDPEDPYYLKFFKGPNGTTSSPYGPTPIDLKFDNNGAFVRLCLNYRLGDYSQKVPLYLWDKKGVGFGVYDGVNSDQQGWDKNNIAVGRLQNLYSISGVTNSKTGETTTNYSFPDGEEEFLIKPMTMNHGTFLLVANGPDMLERFENIDTVPPPSGTTAATSFMNGDLWLEVTSGNTKNPLKGNIYVVTGNTWYKMTTDVAGNSAEYQKDYREIYIPTTAQNYVGNKQVLSTPFLFYFGFKPEKTALDELTKYFGPKGAFPPVE